MTSILTLESARLDVQRAEYAFRHPKPGIAEEARDQLADLLGQARANLRLVERHAKGEPIHGEIRPITIPVELVDGPFSGDAPAASTMPGLALPDGWILDGWVNGLRSIRFGDEPMAWLRDNGWWAAYRKGEESLFTGGQEEGAGATDKALAAAIRALREAGEMPPAGPGGGGGGGGRETPLKTDPAPTEAPAAVPAIEPERKSVRATTLRPEEVDDRPAYGKDDALAYVKAAPASPDTICPVHPVTAMVAEARHRAHGYPVPSSPPSGWCNAALFGALASEVERLVMSSATAQEAAAMPARLQVGIALISRPRTPDVMEYLVQRRPEDASFGAGLWEFPGGKQEERDHGSFARTTVREAWEELAVGGTVKGDRAAAFDLDPPTIPFPIYVEAYRLVIEGDPRPIVASAIEWHTLDEIAGMQVTPATVRIVDDLRRA